MQSVNYRGYHASNNPDLKIETIDLRTHVSCGQGLCTFPKFNEGLPHRNPFLYIVEATGLMLNPIHDNEDRTRVIELMQQGRSLDEIATELGADLLFARDNNVVIKTLKALTSITRYKI